MGWGAIAEYRISGFRDRNDYDFIIIDCPPNLGAITLNGIVISNYYIVPITPDYLSQIGLSLVYNRINQFKKRRQSCNIELMGIIFTKVNNQTNLHSSIKEQIRQDFLWEEYVFKTELPQRIRIAEASVDSKPFVTSDFAMQGKDYQEILDLIETVTFEFLEKLGYF